MGVGSMALYAPTWGSTAFYPPRRARVVPARAVDKGRLIRIRGFSPPRQGIVCKQPLLLSLSAALPRNCIDRCRYQQGLTMQFLAMTIERLGRLGAKLIRKLGNLENLGNLGNLVLSLHSLNSLNSLSSACTKIITNS